MINKLEALERELKELKDKMVVYRENYPMEGKQEFDFNVLIQRNFDCMELFEEIKDEIIDELI